ncbi:hypothetical protein JYU34_005183 [Plutella xylostella]|uniref:Uncharacterized protein n=1 Tax=Plutella xylostella TaxID=51655 RepID=A0ABQ7QW23_PLUXY|nr:hypothetical protein JYU34_005183 [Plutella xylostella]
MSKAMESVIRDMQKSLDILVNKVSALESKIGEQNIIISNQSVLINRLSTPLPAEATPTSSPATLKSTPTPAPTPPAARAPTATQRPVRQARLIAGAAISASRSALNSKSTPTVRVPDAESSPNTTDVSRALNKPIAPTNKALGNSATTGNDHNEEVNGAANEWQTVGKKKRPQSIHPRRIIIEGTGQNNYGLKTVKRQKYIQAWMFDATTTTEDLRTFLQKVIPANEYYIEKRSINTNRHASFVIGIDEDRFDELKAPAIWPPGVRYADWFQYRPRQQRGAAANTTANRDCESPSASDASSTHGSRATAAAARPVAAAPAPAAAAPPAPAAPRRRI